MDDLAQYNKERWEALAGANIQYSRPWLDLTVSSARARLDPQGILERVAGKEVLCLAGSGGQQSAAFALLGARVTVVDLAETQLERDRQAVAHYGLPLQLIQGDMRDLSALADDSFDIVWQPFSINFIPDPAAVFDEVRRVLRPTGLYRLTFANPFWTMDETDWTEQGYPVCVPYEQGAELTFPDPHWDVEDGRGTVHRVLGPREFMHTLGTVINGLANRSFLIQGLAEGPPGDVKAAPGTWEHLLAIIPPFLTIWARYRPDVLDESNHA